MTSAGLFSRSSTYPWPTYIDMLSLRTVLLHSRAVILAKLVAWCLNAFSEVEEAKDVLSWVFLSWQEKWAEDYLRSGLKDRRELGRLSLQTHDWRL